MRILLYGATGYTGRLIAAEAARQAAVDPSLAVVLAGRDGAALERLGNELGLPWQAFTLEVGQVVRRAVAEAEVVINAAGPFAFTAPRLARACILSGTAYVDLCGELDVVKALDDQGLPAAQRQVALVCGAGHTATLSSLMLSAALRELRASRGEVPLGRVQIVAAAMDEFSRGSRRVMMRAVRDQVAMVAAGTDAAGQRTLALTHVPVGRLEATFDFGLQAAPPLRDAGAESTRRIASAANLIDTLCARRIVEREWVGLQPPEAARTAAERLPGQILSFIEMDQARRVAYQWGAWTAPFQHWGPLQALTAQALRALPEGPDAAARARRRHRLLLRIESREAQPLVDWRLDTPDVYEVSARCALAVARGVAAGRAGSAPNGNAATGSAAFGSAATGSAATGRSLAAPVGWCTPDEFLPAAVAALATAASASHRGGQAAPVSVAPLQGCLLYGARTPRPAPAVQEA